MKRVSCSILALFAALVVGTSLAGCSSTITTSGNRPTLNISVSPAGSGTVNPPSGRQYDPNTVVTLAPTAAAGYDFSSWAGSDGASVVANKIIMDKSKSIIAVFVPRIAFTTDRDGNEEIYMLKAGAASPTNLTQNQASDGEPVWSPDGTKIAFISNRGESYYSIYVMNAADGSGQRKLTHDGIWEEDPAWSPDGSKIAYIGAPGQISIVDVNTGSNLAPLPISSLTPTHPSWSPDGTKIAFSADNGTSQIFIIDANGSGEPHQLPSTPPSCYEPAWSPDGTKIAFIAGLDPSCQIWVANADGSGAPTPLTQVGGAHHSPVWHPDGKQIAFDYYATETDPYSQIYVMNATDGSGRVRVTQDTFGGYHPTYP